jgi:hypothetical protein
MQGLVEMSLSHLAPSKPSLHLHFTLPSFSTHVPSFLHGFCWQGVFLGLIVFRISVGFTVAESDSHFSPSKPSLQWQTTILQVNSQRPPFRQGLGLHSAANDFVVGFSVLTGSIVDLIENKVVEKEKLTKAARNTNRMRLNELEPVILLVYYVSWNFPFRRPWSN